jgi:secondary thiamine-phosphate synthase enzyme
MTYTRTISLSTRGHTEVHDLTRRVREVVDASAISSGTVTVFVPGSTAGITTIEYEQGVVEDLRRALERVAPESISYEHDAAWGDGNGYAHVRAALVGPSLSVPIVRGKLTLGTWQQIILLDFDNRPRNREILVQVVGDAEMV